MDKNMINIDDLFKQRFDREEEDRGGAWLRMRELLDEKMPTNVPAAGINWRRMFSYVAGIALLATVTIGGYEVATKSRSNDEMAKLASNAAGIPEHRSLAARNANDKALVNTKTDQALASSASNDANNSTVNKTTNSLNKKSNHSSINNIQSNSYTNAPVGKLSNIPTEQGDNSDDNIESQSNSKDNSSIALNKKQVSNNNGNATNSNGNLVKDNASGSVGEVADNNSTGTRHNKHVYAHANKLPLASGFIASSSKSISGGKQMSNNELGSNDLNPKEPDTKFASGSGHANKKSHKSKDINELMPASGSVTSDISSSLVSAATDKTRRYAPKIQTIQALEIKQRLIVDPETHKAFYRNDTIGKVPVQQLVFAPIDDEANTANSLSERSSKGYAANKGKDANADENKLLPGASSSDAAANSNAKDELAKKRAASNRWDWRSVSEALKDFEYNLGQVKVFPGVIGGVNTTFFGPSSSSGFHLGMTTEFEFNDHWGMMAELKYMQRVNNGVLNNNYVSYKAIDSSGTPQHMAYVIQKDSIQHYFNYSTLHSLELPISLHYKTNNFNIFAGANLVYNFAINTEEIDHKYLTAPTTETFPGNNWQNVLKNSPKYTINDFSSIFGIGYLLGLSYEFTPSIMVDARMTQMVWDNAKTLGAKQISSNLYQSPSAQLSIIYRLNHKKTEER